MTTAFAFPQPQVPRPSAELQKRQARDVELCQAFLEGDTAAFGELYAAYHDLIFRMVRRYAEDSEEARDLTQQAFVRALVASPRTLPRLGRSAGLTAFKAWLILIAINLGKNHARHRQRWRRVRFEGAGLSGSEAPDALQQLERAQASRAMRRAVPSLTRRQREVFTLRVDRELRFTEIAEALSTTPNNCKVHFHQAVKRLKEEVRQQGVG